LVGAHSSQVSNLLKVLLVDVCQLPVRYSLSLSLFLDYYMD